MGNWISDQLPTRAELCGCALRSDKGVCPGTSTDCESVSEDLCLRIRAFVYGPSGSKSGIHLTALTEILEEMPYD